MTFVSGLLANNAVKTILSVVIVAGSWLAARFAVRAVNRSVDDPRARYRLRKNVTYSLVFLSTLTLLALWLERIRSLALFLGALSAGLAIALQDLVQDLAGWVFITWRSPFSVGDRVEIADRKGDVIDIRALRFTMLEIGEWVHADQTTGRIVHMPNRTVLGSAVVNYDRGLPFIWNEVPVVVTLESDWRRAKALLDEIAGRHAETLSAEARARLDAAGERYLLSEEPLEPSVCMSVDQQQGVVLTVRYLCLPRHRRSTAQAIWQEVLTLFAAEPAIRMAYPSQREVSATETVPEGGSPGRPFAARPD